VALVDGLGTSSSSASTNYFAIPPLAVECSLAFLSPPSDSLDSLAYGDGTQSLAQIAGHYLGSLAWDRDLLMQVLGRDNLTGTGRLLVALYDPAEDDASEDDQAGQGAAKAEAEAEEGVDFPVQAADPALTGLATKVSLNELVVQEGLARVSRNAARLVAGRGGAGHVGRPPIRGRGEKGSGSAPVSRGGLSVFATVLLDRLEEAQRFAHRAHVNLFRYGDAPDSDDERADTRDRERGPAQGTAAAAAAAGKK
jgi:hypothetical protein